MAHEIDPRLARMAAALRAKPLTSEEIKKTRAKDFRTFGIEVPRGQLDHYRQALLKEIERQKVQQEKKIALYQRERYDLKITMRKDKFKDRTYLNKILRWPIERRDLPKYKRQLETASFVVLRDKSPGETTDPLVVVLPDLYVLSVSYDEEQSWDRYSKRWHRMHGPATWVSERRIELGRLSPFRYQTIFRDTETLKTFHKNWKRRVFESFLQNTPEKLLYRLLERMTNGPIRDSRGRSLYVMPSPNPFDIQYLGHDGKQWVLENDLQKVLFRTFGRKGVVRKVALEKGPLRVYQLLVETWQVGWFAEMGDFRVVADNMERAVAEILAQAARRQIEKSSSGLEL